jgi:hypothetical protein
VGGFSIVGSSPRRAPARELERMQALYQERYRDFTVKHFHEQWLHGVRLSLQGGRVLKGLIWRMSERIEKW